MPRQSIVIGLGQFGSALSKALAQQGSEVLAVDHNEAKIAEIAPHVADAVLMDAMDEEALASLAPDQRDVCVCAIGDENREGSIVVTALLKQYGAPWIIARATDNLHARILKLVGAHEVINPEKNIGERLAIRLAWQKVVDIMPLGGQLVLTEIETPESFCERTLAELELPKRFGVNVAAVRNGKNGDTELPNPTTPLKKTDMLLLVSSEDAIRRLTERT